MRVVAFVPLKLNNERLPGKNTKNFSDGTPLVSLILNTLKKVSGLSAIYVYCSDESIKSYLPDGIEYMSRDKSLDGSDTKINSVLQSFARDVPADIYVLAHATAPFISVQSITSAVNCVVSGKNDSALTVHKMQEFLWQDGRPYNYDLAAIPRTQDLAPLYVETTGLYVYTHNLISERNVRVGDNPGLIEVSKVESVDINDPVDFDIANAIYSNMLQRTDC